MATVDTGLFGPTPWEIQQAQQQALQTQAANYAQQTPFQRAAQGMFTAGGQLGGLGAQALGGVNVAQQQAAQNQQALQGADLQTPEGLRAAAKKMLEVGNQKSAYLLSQKAAELEKEQADTEYKKSQVNKNLALENLSYQRAEELARSDALKNLPPAVQAILKFSKMQPTDPGYDSLKKWIDLNTSPADVKDAAGVAEYKFAISPEGGGYKGSFTDWLKSKAQATHITVSSPGSNQLDGATVDMLAQQYLISGTLPAMGMGKDAAATRAAVLQRAAELGTTVPADGGAAPTPAQVAAKVVTGKQDIAAQNRALGAFASGVEGRTVRSLNTAIAHLETLSGLGSQLDNGNIPLFNAAANKLAQMTGSAPPTNFDAAKTIVANEVVKAIINNGGSQKDREDAAAMFDRAKTPVQLQGAIKAARELLSGQMTSLENQFVTTTGRSKEDFRKRLTPATISTLGAGAQAAPAGNRQFKVLGRE